MRKLPKILAVVALSLFLGIGSVLALPMPGSSLSLSDGKWSEYLLGGAEGAPGNLLAAQANDLTYGGIGGNLIDAMFLGTNDLGSGIIDYIYLTTYSSGYYTLNPAIWGESAPYIGSYISFEVETHKEKSGGTLLNQYAYVKGYGIFDDPSDLGFHMYATAYPDEPPPSILTVPLANYIGGALENVSMKVEPVPEPATMLLLGSGLVGLAGIGRKKLFKKK